MGRYLGQHFLHDRNIISKIIKAAQLSPQDRVLEIGPGRGAITKQLLELAGSVTAIELDQKLAQALSALPKLRLIKADILDIDLPALLSSDASETPAPPHSWKVVANLPYYITTPILEKLLCSGSDRLGSLVLMIQKEVAERIAAIATRQTGALSYFVNYYAETEYLFTVKPGCFAPPPQVDSAVIRLTIRRQPPVSAPPEQLFRVIRTAFQERRKTLRRSLLKLPAQLNQQQWESVWNSMSIDSQRRPETLTLQDFSDLAEAINKAAANT